MRQLLFHPLAALTAFSLIFTGVVSAYVAAGRTPSATLEVVAAVFWSYLLALWVVADARRRGGIPCFDFGFFCYLFLPLAVLWYCFWSRGWRGWLTLFTLAALWLMPYLVAHVVWQLMYG